MRKIVGLIAIVWITLIGCEDKIDLKLPENTGQLVITADLTRPYFLIFLLQDTLMEKCQELVSYLFPIPVAFAFAMV